MAPRLRHRPVARHRRQHPRLELRRVRHHQPPPGVGDHGAADRRRDLQGAAAHARPPARDHAARHVLRAEPPVRDPRVQPRPAVRRVQPREPLVLEQRLDLGAAVLAQLPRARRRHVDARPPQAREQLRPAVEVEPRLAQQLAHPRTRLLQPRGLAAGCRARAEDLREDPVVLGRAPRQAVVLHLRRDERAGRLRRQQQPQATGRVRAGDRRELAPQLVPRVRGRRRRALAPCVLARLDVEERRLPRRPRLLRGARRVPRARGQLLDLRPRAPRAGAQDRVAQPQVVRPLDPHAGGEQRRVAPRGVVPHPAGTAALALPDGVGQPLRRDGDPGEGRAIVGHVLQHDPPGASVVVQEDQGHAPSSRAPGTRPARRRGRSLR